MTTLATVTLPDNFTWSDEYAWSPVDQSTTRTLSGAMVVEETARQSGRAITLSEMWVDKATVDALKVLEEAVSTEMTLTLSDARTFTVVWKRDGDTTAVEATPIFPNAPGTPQDTFTLILHLMEA